jgi:hypothetical protein
MLNKAPPVVGGGLTALINKQLQGILYFFLVFILLFFFIGIFYEAFYLFLVWFWVRERLIVPFCINIKLKS